MSDLVERVAQAIWDAVEDEPFPAHSSIVKAEARAAIKVVLDDLESPNAEMLEAFYRRWEQGNNPESFNTLLGDALSAMFAAKRKELDL